MFNNRKSLIRITFVALAAIAVIVGVAPVARATVVVTKDGNPIFGLTDFHLFAAPFGTAATGYAEFFQTQAAILPPPNHVYNATLGIGPGVQHSGPYDHELGDGVAANKFVEATTFPIADYSNGAGVFLVFMIVPGQGSPTGSSPDFTSGPIIPNTIFPLSFNGGTYTNGQLNDGLGAFQVPAIDQVPEFAGKGLEGHSHIPLFFADNFDFSTQPVITGNYEYRISVLDANGNGYDIVAAFSVVPEPSTWAMMMLGFLGLGFVGNLRARAA